MSALPVQVIELNPITTQEQAVLDDIAADVNELHAAGLTIDLAMGKRLAEAKSIFAAKREQLRHTRGWQGWVEDNLPFGVSKADDLIALAVTIIADGATGLPITHLHSRAIRILLKSHVTEQQRREVYEYLQTGQVVNEKIATIITAAPRHVLQAWRDGILSVDTAYDMIRAFNRAPSDVQERVVAWGVVLPTAVEWLIARYTDFVSSGFSDDKTWAELVHNGGYVVWDDEHVHISNANETQLDLYMQFRMYQHIEIGTGGGDGSHEPPLWAGRCSVAIVDGKRVIVLPDDALDHIRDYELDSITVDVKVGWAHDA